MSGTLRQLLAPALPLVSAVYAVVLAVTFLDRGWPATIALVAIAGVILLGSYVGGRLAFKTWPYRGGYLMESAFGVFALVASIAGATLLWLAIRHAPGANASTREKEVWAALIGAFTTYLGSVIIKPDGEIANPVKGAIGSKFRESFRDPKSALEKDARSAVQRDQYGAEALKHAGQVVNGWGWAARRLRTRHIQDALRSAR